MSSLSIGQRVVTISSADAASKTDNSLSGLERGTVRYVGEVSGTKGEWIGVEWDDEGRGRHDGTHDGKRLVGGMRPAAFCNLACFHAALLKQSLVPPES